MTRDELRSALLRHGEGLLGEQEWRAVQAELTREAAAREVLVEVNLLTTELRRQLRSGRVPPPRRRAGRARWLAVAAVAVAIAVAVALGRWPRPTSTPQIVEGQRAWSSAIETVSTSNGASDDPAGSSPVVPGRRLSVASGAQVVLQRPDGASFAVVGPADATAGAAPEAFPRPVGDANWLAVSAGEVTVEWPAAARVDGPAVVTAHAWVTPAAPASFSVRAGSTGTTVRVFAGSVDVTRHSEGDHVRVSAGAQALVVGAAPPHTSAESDPKAADELALLRRAPASLLLTLFHDARASVGLRRSPCTARGELDALVVAAALDRPELVDGAFARIDETLARQRPDGGMIDEAYCQAYYLASLAHGLVALRASTSCAPLANAAWERLRPRLDAWASYLAQPAQLRELDRGAQGMTSRLAFFAAGFALMGELLDGRADLMAVAKRYLDDTLALQRADGAFLVDGRHDSGYQGNTLAKLWWVALRLRPPGLEDRLRRGGDWLLGRINARGELDVSGNARTGRCPDDPDGRCRAPNRAELVWGLLYHAARFDPGVFAIAARVHDNGFPAGK